MITITEINSYPRDRFITAVGWVFENSPWVALRAWERRPFTDLEHLHAAMRDEVERATGEEKLRLLRAHPDLGTRARMSQASAGEQAGAGLESLTAEEFERLKRLNADYRRKFGFPFLYAVKGSTKYDILRALDQRLQSTLDQEFREGLNQVYGIALGRLKEVISK